MEILNEYIDEDILKWWGLKQGGGDPITSSWLGVSSVITPITAILTYLLLVNICKYRVKALQTNFRGALIVYNSFQVMFSAFIFTETVITAYNANYNIMCEPLHDTLSYNGRRMANASWMFYISKYLDLLDTAFMIIKGNTRQVSLLHVFHHSSMILNSWFGIRHVPTGHSFFIHLSNSFVHMVMYGYYLLSSFGPRIRPYLWWKPYLTQVQIFQFFLMWVHVAAGLYNECDYPRCLIYLVLIYLVVLIGLFSHFYLKTYMQKDSNKPKKNGSIKNTEKPHLISSNNNAGEENQNVIIENDEKPKQNGTLKNSDQSPLNGSTNDSDGPVQNGFLRKFVKPKENGFIKNTEKPNDNSTKKKRS